MKDFVFNIKFIFKPSVLSKGNPLFKKKIISHGYLAAVATAAAAPLLIILLIKRSVLSIFALIVALLSS
jgi:hypothetical protein